MAVEMSHQLQRALQELTEGIPGQNEAHDTGLGELDNGALRHLLAGAAFVVLHNSAPDAAFDRLAPFFDDANLVDWMGHKRAELILEMLAYQSGYSEDSTWNALRERQLRERALRPDPRWADLCARVHHDTLPTTRRDSDVVRRANEPVKDPSIRRMLADRLSTLAQAVLERLS